METTEPAGLVDMGFLPWGKADRWQRQHRRFSHRPNACLTSFTSRLAVEASLQGEEKSIEGSMSRLHRNPRRAYDHDGREIPPMTLGNMREHGIAPQRTLGDPSGHSQPATSGSR